MCKHVSNEVIRNARLVKENEALKKQLQQSSSTVLSKANHEEAAIGDSTVSAEEYQDLMDKYNDLCKRYQDLAQEMKYLKRKNTTVMQKNRDMKESVRAWQEYADRQSGKQKAKSDTRTGDDHPRLSAILHVEDALPHMPSSPRSLATVRTPLSLADTARSSPAPIAPLTHSESETRTETAVSPSLPQDGRLKDAPSRSGSVTPKPQRKHGPEQQPEGLEHIAQTRRAADVGRDPQSYLRAADPTSSQTTVDETAGLPAPLAQTALAAEDIEDDFPEFISTRSLKRKRGLPAKINIYADRSSEGTPVKPFRIKEEQLSSPPITHNLLRKETIDLDDFAAGIIHTPHHSRQRAPVHMSLVGTPRHQRSNSAPLTQVVMQESTAHELDIHVDVANLEAVCAEARALSEPTDPLNNQVLRSLDPNIIVDAPEQPPSKRMRTAFRERTQHGILAESGEEPPPIDDESRLPPSVARAKLSRKMHPLQDPRTPAKSPTASASSKLIKVEQQPTPPKPASRTTQTPVTKGQQTPQTEARSVEYGLAAANTSVWNMKTPEVRSSIRKIPVLEVSKQGRLRSRPVAELKLQDFKPNPVYNQGYSYAFSETVRKRGDRMCLPGCTNLQCCGSTFRTFAEAQAPLSSSQEETLLEDYLGDAYDNMNRTQMASDERQELVLQARTKKMAKEVGKHREAYERRRTPPGFWRVDFPTTQEHEEDRARAREQEKEIVKERWMEAQRRGGKWIFRDE